MPPFQRLENRGNNLENPWFYHEITIFASRQSKRWDWDWIGETGVISVPGS